MSSWDDEKVALAESADFRHAGGGDPVDFGGRASSRRRASSARSETGPPLPYAGEGWGEGASAERGRGRRPQRGAVCYDWRRSRPNAGHPEAMP